MRAVQRARARAVRVGGAAREQLGGDGARRVALAAPAGPCSRYACDGRPVRGGAEHGCGVRVGLEGGEGHASPAARRTSPDGETVYRAPTCSAAA